MPVRMNIAACAILLAACAPSGSAAAAGGNWTMRLELGGQQIDGAPIHLSRELVMLLGRDGRLWEFAPDQAKNYYRLAGTFRGYSSSEMRAQLLREFGRQFEASGTGHYLVVHPAGQGDQWAGRFEQLYRSFLQYFTARGIRPEPPEFPLVAVVFPSQRAYQQYLKKNGQPSLRTTLGFYSAQTNRVLMYDVTAGRPDSQAWYINAETLIHEATHQTAFNTGVHSRLTPTPCWVVEGLATMFEAQGVWDRQHQARLADRVSDYWLKQFQNHHARQPKNWLRQLVASDDGFSSCPDATYSKSWAVTFYFMERQPSLYGRYLKLTAGRPAAVPYESEQRLADFESVFGDDWTMIEAHVARFAASLSD